MQVRTMVSRCTASMLPQPGCGRTPLTCCRIVSGGTRHGIDASGSQCHESSCANTTTSSSSSSSSSSNSHARRSAALEAGLVAPAILQLAAASPAQADKSVLGAGNTASEAAGGSTDAMAAAAPRSLITLTDAAPDDPVITVLFYVAGGILSVVTVGVAYLAIVSFLDDRAEKEDRKTFDSQVAQRAITQDREKVAAARKPPRRRSSGTGKGGGKGFS